MRCRQAGCTRRGRLYRYGLGRHTTVLCRVCAAALYALGMDLR